MRPTGGLQLEASERDDRSARRVCSITVRAKLKEALESARDELRWLKIAPDPLSLALRWISRCHDLSHPPPAGGDGSDEVAHLGVVGLDVDG
jgi:hypothetical protein